MTGPIRVAVVDGRRSLHDLVTAALRTVGYAVSEYESRSQFLFDFRSERPRIVVMGAHNDGSDVSQVDAVKHLLLSSARPHLPILLFAPSEDDPSLVAAAAIPGTEVLPFPVTAEGIVLKVNLVVRLYAERDARTSG
ncbi:MAG: hypothetical protein LC793_23095 [Thermomicrobia bacterium]|nr:hypothetical protein [Thermomicrobia bacterium]